MATRRWIKISFYLSSSLCIYNRTSNVLTSVPCKPDNYLKPPAVPKPSLCSHLMSAFCGEVSESQDLVIFKKQVAVSSLIYSKVLS